MVSVKVNYYQFLKIGLLEFSWILCQKFFYTKQISLWSVEKNKLNCTWNQVGILWWHKQHQWSPFVFSMYPIILGGFSDLSSASNHFGSKKKIDSINQRFPCWASFYSPLLLTCYEFHIISFLSFNLKKGLNNIALFSHRCLHFRSFLYFDFNT